MTNDEIVKVGVGLLVIKDGKALWTKRKGSFGAGLWGGIGGHVEHGETLEQAILRELAEECGIKVKDVRVLCVSDFLTHAPRHYVDVGFVADWESGEPQILRARKVRRLGVARPRRHSRTRFCAHERLCRSLQNRQNYFTYPADM